VRFNNTVNSILSELFKEIPGTTGEYSTHKDHEGTHVFLKKFIKGKTGVHEYGFNATVTDQDDSLKTATILFYMVKDEVPVSELTEEGNAIEVLNTALGFIRKVNEDYGPDRIVFSAVKGDHDQKESMSRTQIYRKLVDRFASSYGFDSNINTLGGTDVFILTKKHENI